MQQRIKSDGTAISDTCGNTDLANKVEPAGIPSPGRPTTASEAELRRPVVETTSRRIRGGQFSHAQRDDDHEDRDERPTNRSGRITSIDLGYVKECYTSAQYRDNRKGNSKVGEAT